MTLAGLHIDWASASDLPAIVALSQDAFPRDGWSPGSLRKELSQDISRCLVARLEGLVGYLLFRRVLDEVEILQVATAPEQRRRGVGAALVQACLSFGADEGVRVFLLETRNSNAAARKLYSVLGFKEIAVRRRYYRCPTEDAIVMALHD